MIPSDKELREVVEEYSDVLVCNKQTARIRMLIDLAELYLKAGRLLPEKITNIYDDEIIPKRLCIEELDEYNEDTFNSCTNKGYNEAREEDQLVVTRLLAERVGECLWTRSFDAHFNLSCANETHQRGNGNFKGAKWEFVYCPYCGRKIKEILPKETT